MSREPDLAAGHPPFTVLRAAHIEFLVTDLERARAFYVDLLGFVETERDGDRLYLRGYEERDHHGLVLRRAPAAGVGHLAFRVASEHDLDLLERLYRTHGLPTRWARGEAGQGRALRVQDPAGLPVEFVYEIAQAEWLLQRFDRYRGAFVMRLDHFNCQVPDVAAASRWYRQELGFACSEYITDGADASSGLWGVWLHRKQTVHDIALMNGVGPRVHHAGFWVQDPASVLRACDLMAAAHLADRIERGPGRHGLANAFFVYLRDPDNNRIELYTNDYLIADPDWRPVRWALDDPRRGTFWGHPAPASWYGEASPVETIDGGQFAETRPPVLRDRPSVTR